MSDRAFRAGDDRCRGQGCVPPGASIVQQALRAVVLGRGVRLLDGLDPGSVQFDIVRVIDAPGVTHLVYRISSPFLDT